MTNNSGTATWDGGLKSGKGHLNSQSGALNTDYTFSARFEDGPGINPEEIIATALASCYSMFLAAVLEKDGTPATQVHTEVKVTMGKKDDSPHITKLEIETEGRVPGIDQQKFEEKAQHSKENCPVSKALACVPEITLKATLKS